MVFNKLLLLFLRTCNRLPAAARGGGIYFFGRCFSRLRFGLSRLNHDIKLFRTIWWKISESHEIGKSWFFLKGYVYIRMVKNCAGAIKNAWNYSNDVSYAQKAGNKS